MPNDLHLDWETFSRADIRDVGASRYADDPSTIILLAALSRNDEPPVIWDFSKDDMDNQAALDLIHEVSEGTDPVWAHNAPFEAAISSKLWEVTFGCPPPHHSRWRCTQAVCRRLAIEGSLEKAAKELGLPQQKDSRGSELIQLFCVPSKGIKATRLVEKLSPTKTMPNRVKPVKEKYYVVEPGERVDPILHAHVMVKIDGAEMTVANAWRLFRQYCLQDVRTEVSLANRTRAAHFKGDVLEAFQLDMEMNLRGIPVHVEALKKAKIIVDDWQGRMREQFTTLTGYGPRQVERVMEWLAARGYRGADLQAGTVEAALDGRADLWGPDADPEARKALLLRQAAAYAATAKVDTMLECVCHDGRLRGLFNFWGARRTGRASASLVQPHNMKKAPASRSIPVFNDILEGWDADDIAFLHGPPLEMIASCIRHFIHPGEGAFLDADFAQIEARVLAWIAGHDVLLEAFRRGDDLYSATAAATFNLPIEACGKKTPERQMGKVVALACIARDERVLTEKNGLVKIQDVTPFMKVWDGAEWVSHGGVIYKGKRRVMMHDGLRATPDHIVFVDDKRYPENLGMSLRQAADERCLLRTGMPGYPFRNLPYKPRMCGVARVYDILNAGPRNRFTVSGVLVHNCGYGGSIGAFQAFAKLYRVEVPDKKARETVIAYRKNNPEVPRLWRNLGQCAKDAINNPGVKFRVPTCDISFVTTTIAGMPVMLLILPSGRSLVYPRPKIEQIEKSLPDLETGKMQKPRMYDQIYYWGQQESGRPYSWVETWGGTFCENISQATAGDFLNHGMLQAAKAGYRLFMSVHDQVLAHHDGQSPEDFSRHLCVLPKWAKGFPLVADAAIVPFYLKED